MCANLASSIKAASRGEDFLNPCKDLKTICQGCFSGQLSEVGKGESALKADDPLDFLETVKPKKKFKPKLEIQIDEPEEIAGGWGDDNIDL